MNSENINAPVLLINKINLLKPTGYVMHHQLNVQQRYAMHSRCIHVFCIYLRTNSDMCHLQHKLIGFYNRDEKCLLRGTDWVFKHSALRFVFKGLRMNTNDRRNSILYAHLVGTVNIHNLWRFLVDHCVFHLTKNVCFLI